MKISCVASGLLLGLVLGGLCRAADPAAIPLSIRERLWQHPGPVRDSPEAPRLLLVYPESSRTVVWGGATRYAGRVEPEGATVSLNDEPLVLHPGGIFTGTRPVEPGGPETWRFVAEWNGAQTILERVVERPAPVPPSPRRPLSFHSDPVQPVGDYWLPNGESLDVTLWGSVDATAEVRLGGRGAWRAMRFAGSDRDRGGRYVLSLAAPAAARPPVPLTVEFRLRADGEEPAVLVSRLRMGRLDPDRPPLGRVTLPVGTCFKGETGSDRWGNWMERTPFPILAVRGPRVRTGFGHGPTGWLDLAQVGREWDKPYGSLPRLGEPVVEVTGRTVQLTWPARKTPVATVFEHQPRTGGDRVRVHLPGAAQVAAPRSHPLDRTVGQLAVAGGRPGDAPGFELILAGSLWGFGLRCDPAFAIEFRRPPALENAEVEAPLRGLRVMIDAGHGGADRGALGPSGVVESDLNLVQAAWLERQLAEWGAIVRQTRREDRDLTLDQRVDAARKWDPDLFVSLHFNSVALASDPTAPSGPIVFYHYAASEPLARRIAERLAAWWGGGVPPRIRSQNFRVIRNLTLAPSVLVESAFVCNPSDEYRLRQETALRDSARAIAEGIRDHLQAQQR